MKYVSNIHTEVTRAAENIDRDIEKLHIKCDECGETWDLIGGSVSTMGKKADLAFENHANSEGHNSVTVDIMLVPEMEEEIDVDITVNADTDS